MPFSPQKIIILDSVDSTNNYAMGLIRNGEANHGTGIFAYNQTGGKGRRGRQWISKPGANMQFSIVTQMAWASVEDKFLISMVAALSVLRLLDRHSITEAFVKWPNDIIINDKKAAGILIENVFRGTKWQWAVTGIGLNVNQTKFSDLKATSIALKTKKNFDVLQLSNELKEIFLTYIDDWKAGKKQSWLEDYNNRLFKRNEEVKLQTGNRIFKTKITGVSREGKLQTRDAFEQEWALETASIKF